jgi:predicted transcriptional regulator
MDPEEIETLCHQAISRRASASKGLGRSAGEKEIAGLLKMNQETVRHQLRSLHTLGLISRSTQHNGYSLTHAGKKLAQIENTENPRKSRISRKWKIAF